MKKLFIAVMLLSSVNIFAQKTFIHCGKLIDGMANVPLLSQTIIIEGNKIVEVKEGYVTPGNGDNLIDLINKTVLPGLMDMHVHLESETKRNAVVDKLTTELQDIAFKAAPFCFLNRLNYHRYRV